MNNITKTKKTTKSASSPIIPKNERLKSYITITDKIRIKVETDCLTVEIYTGVNNKTGEDIYGDCYYFTSWDSILNFLIKRFTTEKIAKSKRVNFEEATKLILEAIQEIKKLLIGEIKATIKEAEKEVKQNIRKFTER